MYHTLLGTFLLPNCSLEHTLICTLTNAKVPDALNRTPLDLAKKGSETSNILSNWKRLRASIRGLEFREQWEQFLASGKSLSKQGKSAEEVGTAQFPVPVPMLHIPGGDLFYQRYFWMLAFTPWLWVIGRRVLFPQRQENPHPQL